MYISHHEGGGLREERELFVVRGLEEDGVRGRPHRELDGDQPMLEVRRRGVDGGLPPTHGSDFRFVTRRSIYGAFHAPDLEKVESSNVLAQVYGRLSRTLSIVQSPRHQSHPLSQHLT